MLKLVLPEERNRADDLDFYREFEESGGRLEDERYDEEEQVMVRRHWIEPTK